ncbi:unnamed protein product [Linum trigynum]|uniref:Uncharacterized protein n=1 Tax=Linum trigynum TaxID=586398 RepID=A0AAV2DBL3_9ROSI
MLSREQRKTLRELKTHAFFQHHNLEFEVFEDLGARETMEATVRTYSWRRLLCLSKLKYHEFVWEFHPNFQHYYTRIGAHGNAIHFTLGGEAHSLSYDDFARAMDLLLPIACRLAIELSDTPAFQDQRFFERICLPEFVGAMFQPGQTTTTQLHPEWRILN